MLGFFVGLPILIILGICIVAFALYLLPTWIALFRGKKQRLAICLINIFAGWTVIGWLGSLIWASIKEDSDGNK